MTYLKYCASKPVATDALRSPIYIQGLHIESVYNPKTGRDYFSRDNYVVYPVEQQPYLRSVRECYQ